MRFSLRHIGYSQRVVTLVVLLGVAVVTLYFFAGDSPARGSTPSANTQTIKAQAKKRDPLAVELEQRFTNDIRPLISKYCYECHGNGKKKGGVVLDGPGSIQDIMMMAEDWLTAVEVMNAQLMPPEKKPQPTAHERLTIQQWVEAFSRAASDERSSPRRP